MVGDEQYALSFPGGTCYVIVWDLYPWVELNPAYIEIAERRIAAVAPLFAKEGR